MNPRWPSRPLADLCTVFVDGDWVESKDQSPGGIRLVQTGNVGQGFFKDRGEKARYISHDTLKRLRCTEIFAGDCLISRLPEPVGRSCLIPNTGERMITAVDCTIVRFDPKGLMPKFFNYFSQSPDYLSAVDAETTGTTRKRISRSKLGEVAIPVPSLPEQQRIVAILDVAFEAIATARANTEQNFRNAREVYENVLDRAFAEGLDRWGSRLVGEVAERVTKGTTPTSVGLGFTADGPVSFVKVESISADGTIIPERLARVSLECHKTLNRSQLREDDILFSIAGALGRTAVVSADLLPANTNQAVAIIRLKSSADVLPEFLASALETSAAAAQTDLLKAGAAQLNLSLAQLRGFRIPVPTLDEQESVVAQLRRARALSQALSEVAARKLAAIDELKQSLLDRAFAGGL